MRRRRRVYLPFNSTRALDHFGLVIETHPDDESDRYALLIRIFEGAPEGPKAQIHSN